MIVIDVTQDNLTIKAGSCSEDSKGEVLLVFNCHKLDDNRSRAQPVGVPAEVQAKAIEVAASTEFRLRRENASFDIGVKFGYDKAKREAKEKADGNSPG